MLKRLLVGAVATAALMTPNFASAETNAVVGVAYTGHEFDATSTVDWDVYGINGAFSHDFSNGSFLQFDADASRLDADGCCLSQGYGAVHYGVRNDGYSFAGYLSVEEFFGLGGAGVGIEGQLFSTNFVVNGSLGYQDFSDGEIGVTSVQADGAYFFTPNFALTGLAAYSEGQDDLDIEWTTLGVGGEWRFANSPASIVLGYRHSEFESDSGDEADSDAWTVGLNIDLGTDSLQDRARSGPSLNGASALHKNLNEFAS